MTEKKDVRQTAEKNKKISKKTAIKKSVAKSVIRGHRAKTSAKPLRGAGKRPVAKRVEKMAVVIPVVKEAEKGMAVQKKKEEIWATGKRKTAIGRIRFFSSGKGEISINNKSMEKYFPTFSLRQIVLSPFKLLAQEKKFRFDIKIKGGGIRGQAEAIRLGISRALTEFNPEWRQALKSAGFLSRDARIKERKKPGLKRARRAPQWSKR